MFLTSLSLANGIEMWYHQESDPNSVYKGEFLSLGSGSVLLASKLSLQLGHPLSLHIPSTWV